MKTTLKRIVGFIEYLFGAAVLIFVVRNIISEEFFLKLRWIDILRFPFGIWLYYNMIKYGWYWMFNIVDITDVKELKRNDIYFQEARQKAHSEIETFLGYLRQGEFYCSVLIPNDLKKINSKLQWQLVEYLNTEQLYLIVDEKNKSIIEIEILDDWMVKKDDLIIGNYTFKALAEKSTRNGETLSRKSKKIIERIVI